MDASGSVVMHTGTDCDDTSAGLSGLDADNDGFTSCADANGLSDCDSDANTYGIAINEASYDPNDLSTHYCATDADGDGYAAAPAYGCYLVEMTDSMGMAGMATLSRSMKWCLDGAINK